MNETESHPLSDKLGLFTDDILEEFEGGRCLKIVALDGILYERFEAFGIVSGGKILRGSDSKVGACNSGENPPFFRLFTQD